MEIVQEEIKTIKEKYVAYDGTEFDNKASCEEYENSIASWGKLNKVEVNSVNLGLPWNTDEHESFLIKPGTMNEIVAINAFIEVKTGSKECLLTAKDIGTTICLNFGYDYDFCEVYHMESYLKSVKEYWESAAEQLEHKEEA